MTEAIKITLDPYEKLAKTLNRIPNGFPTTEDGTHLKVLEWIFEPEEAEIASRMKLTGQTIKRMSKRLKIPLEKLAQKIETMYKKGQIRIIKTKRGKKYGLIPFVVGIYEEQIDRMDKKFAELFEEYCQKSNGEILSRTQPAIHRVVPIDKVIQTELKVHSYSKAEDMVRKAKSWGIRDCICRKQQRLIDNHCKYPMSVCLSFSGIENNYDDNPHSKAITKEEALRVLGEAREAGLIHTTMNIAKGHFYICNCCTCCCGVLRALVEFDNPNAFVNSDYKLNIDDAKCIGCGECIDRCQFNALEIIDGRCAVDDKCVGCGACAIVCPEDALSLISRKSDDNQKPPKGLISWMLKKALKRKVNPLKVL